MCGIFFSLCSTDHEVILDPEQLMNLHKRGPDFNCKKVLHIDDQSFLVFQSWVLHMRGLQVAHQPVLNNHNVLIWNGEIFGYPLVDSDESDSTVLSDYLNNYIRLSLVSVVKINNFKSYFHS